MSETFYDLSAATPAGKPLPFEAFRGRPVLVVNTATRCGLAPQFEGLEALHQTYGPRGLVVLGFPCDQFLHQEPTSDADMEQVCKMNHGVTFPLTARVQVNGPQTHPVYRYLKARTGSWLSRKIRWNFEKFLISADGQSIKRYAPTVKPEALKADIEAWL